MSFVHTVFKVLMIVFLLKVSPHVCFYSGVSHIILVVLGPYSFFYFKKHVCLVTCSSLFASILLL